uniref:Tr-type G domain-containing protein n=1 Tax=Panagrolaimus sp. ES5 TaxID=591445 RepID=A0AC34FL81_9BILA
MESETDHKLKKAFAEIDPQNIRNVCIIAHVDHGKTTLADSLISSNGIISARYAGKLRYMDSRDDEQTRGITMKSSAVSLYHEPFLINLIDSPGHVDFGSEVNSAVNLADIAILVVDVVEGVCSQTESLLRQSFQSHLDVILVLNKLDRLVIELKMTETEAYRHIQRLIEHVNSCLSQIITGTFLENEQEDMEKMEANEEKLHFDPIKGNVLFASAINGFAFSLDDFASLWSPKLGIDKKELVDSLFSDFYLAGGKIKPDAEAKGKKSLFEQLVLQPVWEVHKVGLLDKDFEKLKSLTGKLGIPPITAKRMDEAFDEFMRNWMSLTKAVLKATLKGKSAKVAFDDEERALMITTSKEHVLYEQVRACDKNSMALAFVAKLLKFENRKVAMCRVMSGSIMRGTKLYAAGKDDSEPIEVDNVYALLGRELVPLTVAPAGSICAIGLSSWLTGTTLCSERIAEPLNFSAASLEPLVRVSIQSLGATEDWDELREGLKQLAILDSAVRVVEQENGELALITAGEVHLQKCIKDLNDMGLINISVSEAIVPFLETIIPDPSASFAKLTALHLTECFMRQFGLKLKLRAIPLHDDIVKYLQKHEKELKSIRERTAEEKLIKQFHDGLVGIFKETLPQMKGTVWAKKKEDYIEKLVDNIWNFGPFKAKYNILVNGIEDYDRPSIWNTYDSGKIYWPLDRAIVAGFDLAMSAGPLCQEPLQGVCIYIEEWNYEPVDGEVAEAKSLADLNDPSLHGQLISAMKATCKAALDKHPRRLVAAMYKCKVQTASQALGKVHTVLAQRRAKVLNEDLNQMNGLFEIESYMPIVESFSFCEQLRKKTSGMAAAQMEFSHWQLIEDDPFWEPTTEEEIEEFGVKGDSVSQARHYVDMVRKRKGILEELIVVSAEKQRNLKRNK